MTEASRHPAKAVLDEIDDAKKDDDYVTDRDLLFSPGTIMIEGASAIHALFNFLLNQSNEDYDIPHLYAPTAFPNASMASLQLVSQGPVQRIKRTQSHGSAFEQVYSLQLKSPAILPTQMLNLIQILQRRHTDFRINVKVDEQSAPVYVNWWDTEKAAGLLNGEVLRMVEFQDDVFTWLTASVI